MDSLRKITPKSSSAEGMLSVQFIVTELQQMQKVDNRCFSRRLRQGVRNAPWKNILGLGHLIFSLMDSLQKKIPLGYPVRKACCPAFLVTELSRMQKVDNRCFQGGLIQGVRNAPWKNIFRSGAFNFQPNRFLAKKYP